ncbi:resiniferatoxin-binding protein [Klebsiella variicola]|uniref:Resiniferatoxin-binding protein n=1 Tax=Klebsiella variicola TaxID=244366 RepID=A0A7H4MKA4_KLEVA|nr:resiniferatoxin-binding protein [Klebsiella variicola]
MTVLGPLPINEMGVTLMHEHILLDASGKWVPPCCCSDRRLAEMPVKMENLGELSLNPLMSRDNCQLFDVDVAIDELTKFRALGGETVVDPTNIGIGRDPKALARIARLTGLNIIMGTGLYLEPSHPEWGKNQQRRTADRTADLRSWRRGGETGGARRTYRRNRYLQPLYAG